MKRIKNIMPLIYDWENIVIAWENACRNKRYREEVLKFNQNLEENLIGIQNDLIYGTYQVGRYREFYIHEPKKRLVMALPFRDRVVQWAIYHQLIPYFDKRFIPDSFACRKGKGAHKAADRLEYWLRQVDRKPEKYYYLKLDIAKYFYRVDHDILMDILVKRIGDRELLHLLETIIRCESTSFGISLNKNEEERVDEIGMPLGNLTSQMFANLYLDELDQFCKQELGIHYYVRYMDDIIILGRDKKKLHRIKEDISFFLVENLRLSLNEKTTIRPCSMGVEFVGYRLWATHRKLKKKTSRRMISSARFLGKAKENGTISKEHYRGSVASYNGVLKHCESGGLRGRMNRAYQEGKGGIVCQNGSHM